MRIAREEIFGPVAAAIPFKDENDAVFQGNDTTYGLAAAVWTRDISRAHKVARALKAGTVWVNCYGSIDPISPFGGYKQSGFGRELGKDSIELYTQIKSVYVKLLVSDHFGGVPRKITLLLFMRCSAPCYE